MRTFAIITLLTLAPTVAFAAPCAPKRTAPTRPAPCAPCTHSHAPICLSAGLGLTDTFDRAVATKHHATSDAATAFLAARATAPLGGATALEFELSRDFTDAPPIRYRIGVWHTF